MNICITGADKAKSFTLLLQAALLGFLVFAFYGVNAADLGFIYDDREQILLNEGHLGTAEIFEIFTQPHFSNNSYFRPISRLFLKTQLTVFGKNSTGIHLTSCFLGGAIAAMLFIIFGSWSAIPSAVLFSVILCAALHPVFSSCIYMISGQESLLSTLLILISVFLFWRHNVISACFVAFAAMLSRENALAMPLFLTAASCFAYNTMQAERQNQKILNLAAIWLTAIIYLFLRHHILQNSVASNLIFQPSKPFMAFLYLLQTVILPEPELVYEPAELVWVSLSTVFALLIFIFALFRCRNSIGTPAAKTWAAWIFIMFLPTSNLLLQQTAYDERHILIALPGFVGLFLAVSGNFLSSRPKVSLALILTMTLMLGIISQNRAQYFRNEFTFANQWLKTNPHAGEPYAILGGLFRERGQLETAQKMYEIAIYYNPSLVSAYDNLGSILGNAGLHERAASTLKTGVSLELENPFCRYNLAMAFFNSGLYNECLAQLHLAKMYTRNNQNLNSMIDESFFHVWFSILCWRFQLTSPIF